MAERNPITMAAPSAEYRELAGELDAAVLGVLSSGRYILGPEGEALEREIAGYTGAAHAIGVANGTDALHLALRAAGIGPGDEVVVPAFTFIATAEAVTYAGATPVFVDVDPDTFCMDVRALEGALTARTRAVIPVHLYGQTAPIARIAAICAERKLVLVEDAAQAIGADEEGRRAGTWGDFGCFSFYPTKNLAAAGDAGLVTARDPAMAERVRMLRHHGSRQTYVHEILGYNNRLDEIQAAILRVKLRHLDRFNEARERIADLYRRRLAGSALVLPQSHGRGRHVWHQFTIRSPRRDALRDALTRAGIASSIFYPTPLHRAPIYAEANRHRTLPVAEMLSREVLSLPIHPYLTEADAERVCDALLAA